ncbi:MAG TPA: hypothetical protein VGG34_08440 [Opitutaceae bacterium]|jgi:hypothetical protein
MSLINDALKKAARQRAEEDAHVAAPMPGGRRRVARQGEPMRTQTVIMVGVSAVILVVGSAIATGYFLTSRPDHGRALLPRAPAAAPAPAATPAPLPPKIVIQPAPAAAKPEPAPVAAAPQIQVPPPVVVTMPDTSLGAPAAKPAVVAPPTGDAIQAIIDAYHVSGVRAAGADSKALIDGHVYRINDIIDHAIGLKLVKVDEVQLTFQDRSGATFTRSF